MVSIVIIMVTIYTNIPIYSGCFFTMMGTIMAYLATMAIIGYC